MDDKKELLRTKTHTVLVMVLIMLFAFSFTAFLEYKTIRFNTLQAADVLFEQFDEILNVFSYESSTTPVLKLSDDIRQGIDLFPTKPGMNMFVADPKSGEIVACTDGQFVGCNIADYGVFDLDIEDGKEITGYSKYNETRFFCIARRKGDFYVCINQDMSVSFIEFGKFLIIVILFVVIAGLIFAFVVNKAVNRMRDREHELMAEIERESTNSYKNKVNTIMRNALEETDPVEAIKVVMKGISDEVGAQRCFLTADGKGDEFEKLAIEWLGTDEAGKDIFRDYRGEIKAVDWSATFVTGEEAVIFSRDDVAVNFEGVTELLDELGISYIVAMGIVNKGENMGLISIADPDLEKLKESVAILQQMDTFLISLLKLNGAVSRLERIGDR